MRLRLALLVAVLTAGCATETRHPVSGPPLSAVTEDEAGPLLTDLRLDLKDVSTAQIGGHPLAPRVANGMLRVELAQAALFEEGNAQMRVEALKPLSEIAGDIAARGGCVVHVVAFGADLAERRASSLADNFAHHSIPPARLRFESRADEKRGDRIVIVLRPVVISHEPAAWMPPAIDE